MCTLIVNFQQHERTPLVIAANRDESRSRPASPPRRWPGEHFVAPRDELGGGTWLGLTSTGMFVGVTNRYPSDRHPERESRGTLVVEALRAASAKDLHERLRDLDATRFNTFHLLYADANDAFVTWNDGAQVHHDVLTPGLHIVTERSLGGDDHGRTQLIRSRWPTLETKDGLPTERALQKLLGTHADDPAGGVCVDVPGLNYGTRSALVLFVERELKQSRWSWAEGPPDSVPFVDQPELIASLSPRGEGQGEGK